MTDELFTESPTPHVGQVQEGRNQVGQFTRGNALGKSGGNPNVKRMSELKRALIACGTEEDIQKLYGSLLAAALDGDTSAAKLLLDHLVGRPTQPIEVTGAGTAPIQNDVTNIVAIIREEEPDPDRRLRIARRILQLGQQTEAQPDERGDGSGIPA